MSALRLRLTHYQAASAQLVEIAVEEPLRARQAVTVPFVWSLSTEDRENLRWYFEDYVQFPSDPAPQVAERVEGRMAELGKDLFRAVFATEDARDLWAQFRGRLDGAAVEVLTAFGDAFVPWELLWDPRTDVPVAIRAAAFTRNYANPAQAPRPRFATDGPVRILLVICRPGGADDVPFRSVASRLVKGLGDLHGQTVDLDVLRPPTFLSMAQQLRRASEETPYHVVHFDGHGTFEVDPKNRGRGYLLFERAGGGTDKISGSDFGALLTETSVPFLILNACRSAHAEPSVTPVTDEAPLDDRVRAYGSLAYDVMNAGVTGVVAMQYNVYVPTAAQFVGDLYATLARGQPLGRAASLGRKQLHADPRRDLIGLELNLRDWPVPVVYEAAAVPLFPHRDDGDVLATIHLDDPGASLATEDPLLPVAPEAGFYGRDETLLALDRAFDSVPAVLVHAYAGSGKTAVAAEFARWYALTGGVDGPVLFTNFERYTPLAAVLDDFARIFGPALERHGFHWLTLSHEKRRELALLALSAQSALWIWDNVEPVAGFPSAAESAWSVAEQQELFVFLRDLQKTKARVLLTSRRDEHEWLGDYPARLTMPAMPFQERVQLARAIALRRGQPIRELAGWKPLLEFTGGNPLTINVVVGEAIQQRLSTPEQFDQFVEQLQHGVADLPDDDHAGRTRSLSASLSFGFKEAFDDADRARLALLHLFDSVVDAWLFAQLGKSGELPEMSDITPDGADRLLRRAAEIGHLTPVRHNVYRIHPALPGYFKALFDRYYIGEAQTAATHAYCQTFASAAHGAQEGGESWIAFLSAHEPNMINARRLARRHGWEEEALQATSALTILYEHQGRFSEFGRLLEAMIQEVIDPATDRALPGHDRPWHLLTQWRVRYAFATEDLDTAYRLQGLLTESVIAETSDDATAGLDEYVKRSRFRSAAVALNELGLAQIAQQQAAGLETLKRALDFAVRADDRKIQGEIHYNLGVAHLALHEVQDLDSGERHILLALETLDEDRSLQRSRCYGELGFIAFKRAESSATRGDQEAANAHFRNAISAYEQGLALTPEDATESVTTKHMNLGTVYLAARDFSRARRHFESAIRGAEQTGQRRVAGLSRAKIANILLALGHDQQAVLYAQRALEDLEPLGPTMAETVHELREMIGGRGASAS